MAINDDLAYEVNENGERVMVRSIESVERAYVRFTNTTSRPVDVSRRDFNGKKRLFATLEPGTSRAVNTYMTHPWEFTDKATKESYMINNNPIFRAPVNLADVPVAPEYYITRFRTNWNITVGVRTLRHTVLLCVALVIPEVENVYELELPRPLEEELILMITELKNVPERNE